MWMWRTAGLSSSACLVLLAARPGVLAQPAPRPRAKAPAPIVLKRLTPDAAPLAAADAATSPLQSTLIVPEVQGIDSRAARSSLLLAQLLKGGQSVEQLRARGELRADDALYILSQRLNIWGHVDGQEADGLRRALAYTVWQGGGESLQRQAMAPDVMERRLRLWLADALGSVGDARVLAMCEQILKETTRPVAEPDKDGRDKPVDNLLLFHAIERMAWFYRDRGEFQQSGETWLRLEPLLSEPGWWLPDSLVAAARTFARGGYEAQAKVLYARVPQFGNDYFTGLVRFDHARDLMNAGRHSAARPMLEQAIQKARTDESKAMLLALLSYSYRLKGEWAQAKRTAGAAMRRFEALPAALRGGNTRGTESLAQSTLQEADGWLRAPIQVEPREIVITIAKGSTAPVVRRLQVRMLEDVSLKVSSDAASIQAHIVTGDGWESGKTKGGKTKEVVVEITPDATLKADGHALVISSPGVAFQARVPVKIEVR